MNKILLVICFFIAFKCNAEEFKLKKLIVLSKPWGLTFYNSNIILTEKSGKIIHFNISENTKKEISHNLNFLEIGQGGLLDIKNYNNKLFICYTEKRVGGTSTSIASGFLKSNNIVFKNIFRAEPPIDSGYHFGCRIVIKDNMLFASVGERGQGMIAQDHLKHPGSIIRINLDGTSPKTNPKYVSKKKWLPEIYQIGIRNPQGMTLSPFDNKIYISNHGPRGGDFFGEVKFAENYGWKIIAWGGTNYNLTKIGDGSAWKPGFTKPLKTWVPSIAVSATQIYKGKEFPSFNKHILLGSLKDQSLIKINFENSIIGEEKIIFKNKIGRIRDLKIDANGKIYLLSNGPDALWLMSK